MQVVLQPHSSYLDNTTEKSPAMVMVVETIQKSSDMVWRNGARKMEMMKLETYSMWRGQMVLQQEAWEGAEVVRKDTLKKGCMEK